MTIYNNPQTYTKDIKNNAQNTHKKINYLSSVIIKKN